MSSTAPRLTLALLGLLLVPRLLSADVIYLRNGNIIDVDSWQRNGDFVEYYQFGGKISVRASEVLKIEGPRRAPADPEPSAPVPAAPGAAPAAPAAAAAPPAVAPVPPARAAAPPVGAPAPPAAAAAPARTPAPAGTADAGEAASAQMLGQALRALSAGDIATFVSHFRYVDDPKWPDERSGLTRVFSLLRDRLGRPGAFELVSTTSPRFLNILIESATPDEWRRSDCIFKSHVFKTTLVEGKVSRPAEVIVEVCQARTASRSWLRNVDIHFLDQDPKVAQTLQEIAKALPAAAAAPRP
jgi:hypothetical protein